MTTYKIWAVAEPEKFGLYDAPDFPSAVMEFRDLQEIWLQAVTGEIHKEEDMEMSKILSILSDVSQKMKAVYCIIQDRKFRGQQ